MSDDSLQTHPLYTTDRDEVDALLGHQGDPGPEHLTTAGRLLMRYSDFPGAEDIKQDLGKVMASWGLDRSGLNTKCREYLGHIDIGLPIDLLNEAEDVARRLQNLGVVFEGRGVVIAVRVGKVLAVWHSLQQQLSSKIDALPRTDARYVSYLEQSDPMCSLQTAETTRADIIERKRLRLA